MRDAINRQYNHGPPPRYLNPHKKKLAAILPTRNKIALAKIPAQFDRRRAAILEADVTLLSFELHDSLGGSATYETFRHEAVWPLQLFLCSTEPYIKQE